MLRQNNYSVYIFAVFVRETRKVDKRAVTMLFGPTNCQKVFLLSPLELNFKTFMNPASGKYARVDLEDEVPFWNDSM